MKLNFLANLKAKGGFYKILANVILALIVIGIGAAAWFGWQQYRYMQTSEYAFLKIKETLQPPNPGTLSKYVDFNSLSGDLAQASSRNFPFFMAGDDQERRLKDLFQTTLLNRLLTKEEVSRVGADQSEEERLKKPMYILPNDFLTQLATSLNLQPQNDNRALVSAKIENPDLKKVFTMVMSMERDSDGWKVRHVVNADELVSQLRNAALDRYGRVRDMYRGKNENTMKRMNDLIPIQSCTAHAGLLSDRKTMLMVVNIIARNTGPQQVNNFNVDATIMGRRGQPILRRYLNAAMPVAPGEDFNHSWTFDLDASSPLARNLLAAGPLRCQASWQTLGLNSAEVLHIVELPYQDEECGLPGHNHPQGFCQLPVFRR